VPVPGPSALIAALSLSGLLINEFTFVGFLPAKKTQRQKALAELKTEKRTLVFYEAPHRIVETMEDMIELFGDRTAALIKELTKIHEEVLRGSLAEIFEMLSEKTVAGEYVIVVEGRQEGALSFGEALDEVRMLMKKGKGRKEAVKMVSEQYGLSKKELYDRSLSHETG
jgi:16S rRNA (cytidine1402-2'-O)-methyltransferase